MPSPMSTAEIAEDRYEQIHGPIAYWSFGVQSQRAQGDYSPLAVHKAFDVASRADALDGIEGLADGADSTDENEAPWLAFAARIEAERVRVLDPRDPEDDGDLNLIGPDGLHYWIEAIDRS